MEESPPLYHSRNIKVWFEYLQKFHPESDLDAILYHASMDIHEIEDQGHWFTQLQIDRFYDAVISQTHDADIARKAGQYVPFCEGLRYFNQFAKGFLSPHSAYMLLNKSAVRMTNATKMTTRQIGSNKVEVISVPQPGVNEKPYQCENRTGLLESIPQFFTGELATIDHPECIHNGGSCCRYILSWTQSPEAVWKQIRNLVAVSGTILSLALFFFLTMGQWVTTTLAIAMLSAGVWVYQLWQGNRTLRQTVRDQSSRAGDYMDEMNKIYKHAALVQEIGQITSSVLNEGALTASVMKSMEKHLDYDRGIIMLAAENRSRLVFSAGYGYGESLQASIEGAEFNLTNPHSKGVFVKAFKKQKPYLIDNLNALADDLSPRSIAFVKNVGATAMVCVPIIYEKQSLGILVTDNVTSMRALRQSDISLLSGIASQTAVGIINARAFQKLIESEKKYRELVENANSIILRRDPAGVITFFNEFAQRRFGYSEQEIIGQTVFGTILPDAPESRHEFDNLIRTLKVDPETHIVTETESSLKNNERVWITWTHRPIMDSDGNILEILDIGNDITQLKRAQSEKIELELRLHRAEKMEAIGTLAGGVAHDLNNILAGMVSYPELLMLQIPEDSPLRKGIATIQKSGEKASAIVQDLLTLARRGVAVADVVDLNEIVAEYLASPEHKRLAENFPSVRFEIRTDPNLFHISGSTVHLAKTLMNLVGNAAEAIEMSGTVTISTQNQYVDRPVMGYDDVQKGDYSVLQVSDTGTGIPPEDINRIFEPFFTKKKMGRTSGTGLGMAVVWGTVKDHKGYVDVKSEIGQGSTVTLYFPSTRRKRKVDLEKNTIEAIKGEKEMVVVIDDMADQREIAQGMLECLNYEVVTMGSGEEAVDYLREHRADLLVLDMIMEPGIDGLETYSRILEFHPVQKAIITSGYSETDKVKATQRLGAGTYVKKPYSIESIGKAIRHTLSG